MRPYIGITGFTTEDELRRVALCYLGTTWDPFLMAGILVSSKTLRGLPNKWPQRYPAISEARRMMSTSADLPDAKLFVHYNMSSVHRGYDLLTELLAMVGIFGQKALSGFQLNMVWPSAGVLSKFLDLTDGHFRMILQVGETAWGQCTGTEGLVTRLRQYVPSVNVIDYVLLDPSGGLGKEMDVNKIADSVAAIYDAGLPFGVGIAGGLSDENVERIAPLLERYPNLSIDAEGRLRTSDDHLDIDKAIGYANNALSLYITAKKRRSEELE
jgi:hypothetical protein